MTMQLEEAFRKLRDAWFHVNLYLPAHEREWEDEERETSREELNAKIKARYDEETDAIICGEDCSIAPSCQWDMDRKVN